MKKPKVHMGRACRSVNYPAANTVYPPDYHLVTCERCRRAITKNALNQAQRVKELCEAMNIPIVIGFPKAGAAK